MIRVEVEKTLDSFRIDAAFEAASDGVTALFGRSGAGKSSIINMLAGLATPDKGLIEIDGETLFDSARGIDVPPHRRRFGYVFQNSRLFPHFSVRGNLLYGYRRTPAAERAVGVDEVVDVLGVAHLLDRRTGGLSGGERQRVALGRAILSNPRALLMDEPLASLDAARKFEVLPFIEQLRDRFGVPIVYVSHAMDEIIRLADTLVIVDDGSIAAVGPVEDITSRLDLRPLTGRYEAGSAFSARIVAHDDAYALTTLAFEGGELRVPRVDGTVGDEVRLRVRARDVSLSLSRPKNISEINILKGNIAEIGATAENSLSAHVDIRVDVGVPLWVRVTRWSLENLSLAPGTEVFATIKSTSIDRQTMGGQKNRDEPTETHPAEEEHP
jgi:molybdate transport system ATP-binding protein